MTRFLHPKSVSIDATDVYTSVGGSFGGAPRSRLAGCTLLHDAISSVPAMADPLGEVRVSIAIPNPPARTGARGLGPCLIFQTGTATPLVASNGSEGIVR